MFVRVCTHICLYEYTLLADFRTDRLERRKRIRPLVPFTFERRVFSVLIGIAGHVHFCLPGIHSQPRYWLDLGAWRCSSLASITALDSATFTVTHLSVPVFAVASFRFSLPLISCRLFNLVLRGCYVFFCQGGSNSAVNYGARYRYINNDLYLRKR